jgi:glycerol dehydrogenase
VAFGLLTQLGLEGQPQTEINEILHYQKAVGLPITLAQVGVEVTAEALVAALKVADQLGRKLG